MNILLICYAGMSTSILAQKLADEAERRGYEASTVRAVPMTELEENLEGVTAIILGPQVRFAEKDARAIAGPIPLMVASPQDFGLMRADAIMDQIEALLAARKTCGTGKSPEEEAIV